MTRGPVPITKDDPVYQFILRYIKANRRSPTYREIGIACYISEDQGVCYRVNKLIKAGYIRRRKYQQRDITIIEPHP